ncbi:MAG: ABC transporter substrate-binding protein [Leptolyngbyaceae bacterium]|nr:ABC transporter substrate-binding protein [Leptolyngbyaceae bacterium]
MSRFDMSLSSWGGESLGSKVFRWAGTVGLCAALAVGCTAPPVSTEDPESSTTTEAESEGKSTRVTMGTTQKVRTLDPADSYEVFPGILLYNLGDRLYTYKPGTTELIPQLATEMPTVSEDGLTYTIPLREGVKFHDGSDFNAEVMVHSLKRFMENGGRPSFLMSDQIASVEATGDYELTITLKSPFAAFTALLTFWGITPVPPDAYPIAEGEFIPDTFIGTGPYKLVELTPDTIRFEVFEDYWGEAPANDGYDIQLFASAANLYNTFKTGGLDIAYQTLDPEQIRDLEATADANSWRVIEAGTTVTNYMMLNTKQPPLNDVNVRRAIAAMIDRTLLNERVFQGQAEPLYSLIPTSFDIYQPVFKDLYGDGDAEKAKGFLAEAGFNESNPLVLEIWYPSSSTERNLVATTLEASIEKMMEGIVDVEVKDVESATAWPNIDKGVYPTFLLNWYPDFFDADTFIQPFMECLDGTVDAGCNTSANSAFYFNPMVNDLISKQRQETDPKARDAYFGELQQVLGDEVPYIPLWQNKDYIFAQDGVENVSIEPTQQFLLWQVSK